MVRLYRLSCLLCIWFLGISTTVYGQHDEPYLNEAPLPIKPLPSALTTHQARVAESAAASCNRITILNDYTANFLGSAVNITELGWTGSVTNCLSGSISTTAQARTIQRINYYRRLVGLPDNITFDASHNTETQAAALIMKANNSLSHAPPSTWTCYSAPGYTGASNSNLALGSFASSAVKQFMDDGGSGNTAAGHRRWILYSKAASFGHGSTDNSDILWVFNPTVTPASIPPFIAFPAQGYVPRSLIPARWSFGVPRANADLSNAVVTMQDEAGANIAVTAYAPVNGYGDNTLVWDITNPGTVLAWSGVSDKLFKVSVSGVKINGILQPDYVYNVVAIDPSTPVFTVTGVNPPCNSTLATGSATVTFDRGAKSILWNTGATSATISGLTSGTYTVTVTDKNDCPLTASVVISNAVSNTPSLTATATAICGGESVVLTAANCSGTLSWSNGLGTGTSKTVTPAVTTQYSVTCAESSCPASSTSLSISVTPGPAPACSVSVTNGLSLYYGVENFTFGTINVSSGTSNADLANYVNRSCTALATVTAGNSYTMSVKGYYTNSHVIKVYIDYSNTGNFQLVLSGTGNLVSGSVFIPMTAVTNTPLRIRVLADPSSASNACQIVGQATYGAGQIEDYAMIVSAAVCTSMYTVKSGSWNDAEVWSCNRLPLTTDTLQINHLITIPASYVANAQKLRFDLGGKLSYGSNARLVISQ